MKVGVLLSGCGVEDGSEIYEAVLTILALENAGAQVVALAPDIRQAYVYNHYSGSETRLENRDVLAESARIVRGKISSLTEVSAHDIDALIMPGGYGAVRNLCTYAFDGIEASVDSNVARLITELHGLGKPIGAICIAPMVVALALKSQELKTPLSLTVGNSGSVGLDLTKLGVRPVETNVEEICIDTAHKVVSTAAFMLAETPKEAQTGINKLVSKVIALVQENSPGYRGEPAVSKVESTQ